MRIKILAAITAIAGLISVASCHWFSSNNKTRAPFNIEGKWVVDSIHGGNDSSSNLGLLVLALAMKDSVPPGLQFNADSTFIELASTDSVERKYYIKDKELFLQEDSAFVKYTFDKLSDSAIMVYDKDSLYITLKRL